MEEKRKRAMTARGKGKTSDAGARERGRSPSGTYEEERHGTFCLPTVISPDPPYFPGVLFPHDVSSKAKF